jgi:hypothetical protein
MDKVWERLEYDSGEEEEEWMRIYKTLLLIDAFLRKGSQRCVDDIKKNKKKIKGLCYFNGDNGEDQDFGYNSLFF